MALLRISVVLGLAAACSSRAKPDGEPRASGSGSAGSIRTDAAATSLVARFEPPAGPMPASTAKLAFTVENRGAAPASLPLDTLESAIFVLEVFDATGARRHTIPPGVPPANYQPRFEPLASGQRRRFELTLNVFSPELAPGEYTAKLRSDLPDLESEVGRFTIAR